MRDRFRFSRTEQVVVRRGCRPLSAMEATKDGFMEDVCSRHHDIDQR